MKPNNYVHFTRIVHISHWQPVTRLRCFEIYCNEQDDGTEKFEWEERLVLGMETTVEDFYHGPRRETEDYSLKGLAKAYSADSPAHERCDKLMVLDEVGVYRIRPYTHYEFDERVAYVVMSSLTDGHLVKCLINDAIERLKNHRPKPQIEEQ